MLEAAKYRDREAGGVHSEGKLKAYTQRFGGCTGSSTAQKDWGWQRAIRR